MASMKSGRIARGQRAACVVAALGALLAVGCAPSEPTSVVGAVEGTDAVIAASADGDQVTFYLCGGPSSYAEMTRWFTGSTDGRAFSLESDGFTVEGDLDAAQGTVTGPDGASHPWSAHPLTPGTLEGLYEVMDSGCRTGAVITQPSADAEPSLQGTWCDASGLAAQVTPVLPIERSSQGVAVRVVTPKGERGLFVQPLTLPLTRQ